MTEPQKEPANEKEIAWYAAALDAWYGTRLEHDKSLLTLSTAGIGLLITLASTVGIPSRTALAFSSLAILAFIVCLVAVLFIFRGNSDHLEDVVHGRKERSRKLAVLDWIEIYAFLTGVILSCFVGFVSAAHSAETKGVKMADVKKTTTYAADSVNGIHRMKPSDKISKSFDGIVNMAPEKQGAAQTQGGSAQSAKPPAPLPAETPSDVESK
jgi:hypothetical protein